MEPNEITRCFCCIPKVMAWDCNRITIKKKKKKMFNTFDLVKHT